MPLSDQGLDEARQAADRLSQHMVAPIASFEASPLRRAQQTASIIGQAIGQQANSSDSLADWNTGRMAGKLVKDVLPLMQHYVSNVYETPPNGEPIANYLARFVPAMKAKVNSPGVHVVVGHARGSSILEGIGSPIGGVGGDVDQAFMLAKPKLKPGGIMIIPPDWNIQIDNGSQQPQSNTSRTSAKRLSS